MEKGKKKKVFIISTSNSESKKKKTMRRKLKKDDKLFYTEGNEWSGSIYTQLISLVISQ